MGKLVIHRKTFINSGNIGRNGSPLYQTYHYNDAIMGAVASQITSLTIVYSTVDSDADQRKHQSSASLAFVWGIHRGPMNSPHKWPVTRKMFSFDDIILRSTVIFSTVWTDLSIVQIMNVKVTNRMMNRDGSRMVWCNLCFNYWNLIKWLTIFTQYFHMQNDFCFIFVINWCFCYLCG